jgi:NAD(P)-dependent dehydrogenase (short-subunit alcohol dehydrogenase family)
MKSQVVLITGAAGGIGIATANHFHQKGWQVVGVDLKTEPEVQDFPGRYVCSDLSVSEAIHRLFTIIADTEGRLDALINNAAIQITKSLIDTEVEEWDALMSINVRAAYLCIKNAYPMLAMRGGSIVNVSSVHALATSIGMASYATSKGALVSLTRAASLELAKDHIRVNAILPGAVETSMLHSGLARDNVAGGGMLQERLNQLARKHPMKRIAKPDEIARIIYVLSDNGISSFVTGQSIVVDGGVLSKLSSE